MNRFRFSYYITTHFILRNKDYNFCRNLHLVYQTQPWYLSDIYIYIYLRTNGRILFKESNKSIQKQGNTIDQPC